MEREEHRHLDMRPIHLAIIALASPWVLMMLVAAFKLLGNLIADFVVLIIGGPI